MSKKIVIFGGSGFVGGHLAVQAIRERWEVHLADIRETRLRLGPTWHPIGITDFSGSRSLLERLRPSAIINTAAIADIDTAENNHDLATGVNVNGAISLARIASGIGARYIFFSSDAVFDGNDKNYHEESATAPVNFYGHTKAIAEREILKYNPGSVIIRISLVLGYPLDEGNSFLKKLELQLKSGEQIAAPGDIIRTPIDVSTLSAAIVELAGNTFTGILHLGSTQSIDRYSLTRIIAEKLGYDPDLILKTGNIQNSNAPRHINGILDVTLAQKTLKTRLHTISETIENALKS